jgi:hypothetical protein
MACIDFFDRACYDLFARYPAAATLVNHHATIRSMTLMLRDGHYTEFFVLSHDCAEGQSSYTLRPWPLEQRSAIEADASNMPGIAMKVLTLGVPIPRHGSLFGWTTLGRVTALIAIYSKYRPTSPEPYWAVMPLVGTPKEQWPPFTGEPDFGKWFWKHHKAGSISPIGSLIAATRGAVFWADTRAILGSDCCAVARELRSPEGYVLPRGRYVYYEALRADKPVPSLRTLLAATGKTDLANRFRLSVDSDI